jgi:O-antigen/teichoic acid export membrane protein
MPLKDTPDIARHSVFLTVSQIIQVAVAFGANLVLVRYLAPADFGNFAIALAGIVLAFSLLTFRMNILIIRADDETIEAQRDRYYTVLTIETLLSAMVAGGWILLTAGLSVWQLSLVAALAARHWIHQNKAFYERSMPYDKLSAAEGGISIIAHLCAVALIVSGVGPAVLYIREIILTLAELAILWAMGGLTICRLTRIRMPELRILFRAALPYWLDGMIDNAYQRLLILAAAAFGGAATAGLFFQAHRLAVIPTQLLAPVMLRLAGNWIGRATTPQDQVSRRKVFIRIAFFPLLLVGIATYLWADPLVPWLFGENWARSADLLAGMCGAVTFMALFETLKAYCAIARRMRLFLVGRIIQYVGTLMPLAAALAGWVAGDLALAIGLSIAFFIAFSFVALMLQRSEAGIAKSDPDER